jgi:hypothetical protein
MWQSKNDKYTTQCENGEVSVVNQCSLEMYWRSDNFLGNKSIQLHNPDQKLSVVCSVNQNVILIPEEFVAESDIYHANVNSRRG